MSRKSARVHAFMLIFQLPFNEFENTLEALEKLESAFELYMPDAFDISKKDEAFILQETDGTINNLKEIDELIDKKLVGWDFNRVSKVDLAAMRLSTYELLFDKDIPTASSINETLEIIKVYGNEESVSFVNGILASVAVVARGEALES